MKGRGVVPTLHNSAVNMLSNKLCHVAIKEKQLHADVTEPSFTLFYSFRTITFQ